MNNSWPFLSSLLSGFSVALLLHPPKSDDKDGQKNVQLIEGSFGKEILVQVVVLSKIQIFPPFQSKHLSLDLYFSMLRTPVLASEEGVKSGNES